jgi:hypothetical protein
MSVPDYSLSGNLILHISREIIEGMPRFAAVAIYLLLLCSCAAPARVRVDTPQGKEGIYPARFEAPPDRGQQVNEAWKNLLAELNLPFSQLDLYPVLNTPRSLPADLVGRINIAKKDGAFGELEAKESLRSFIERARGILVGDPRDSANGVKDLSLVSFTKNGNSYRVVYQQASYSFPVANGYGELTLTVDETARLIAWSSRLIPKLDLPANPSIDPEELAEKLIGREFTYTTIAGNLQTYKVAKREDVVIKDPVVYPKQEGHMLTVYLAYPVDAGNEMTWTVYFDAINGQELGVKQNFVS